MKIIITSKWKQQQKSAILEASMLEEHQGLNHDE